MPTKPPTYRPPYVATAPRDYAAERARRELDPAQAAATAIRNGRRWKSLRYALRVCNPLCCDPLGEHGHRIEPTEAIHHIEPLHLRPDLAYDLSNLAPVCRRCHDKVEARMRRGEAAAHLFAGKKCKASAGCV